MSQDQRLKSYVETLRAVATPSGEARPGLERRYTDAKIEPGVKVVGVFPANPDDPIVYPVAATVNAKPGTTQYLAFLRSAEATSIFEGYGFSVLAKPTLSE